MTPHDLSTFAKHYLICALWLSTYDDGKPMDQDYSLSDIAPETLKQAADDCSAFEGECDAILVNHESEHLWNAEQFGHDFWLSRNGHGTGFFDRGNDPVWDALQAAARVWGSVDLYVGDDGQIHG